MKALFLIAYVASSFVFQEHDPVKGVKNQPPLANAGDDVVYSMKEIIQLDGTASREPDGIISRYQWTQISGTPAIIANPHAAITAISGIGKGEYSFRLTVTDEKGGVAIDEIKISVKE